MYLWCWSLLGVTVKVPDSDWVMWNVVGESTVGGGAACVVEVEEAPFFLCLKRPILCRDGSSCELVDSLCTMKSTVFDVQIGN